MALSIFTRIVNFRNVLNINNINMNGGLFNTVQNISSKSYCTAAKSNIASSFSDETQTEGSNKKINKAMKIYLKRSKDYKEFIETQIAEYNIGKRHLANMMGVDPEELTQADINNAIAYLFPSGLYDPQARPIMEHPDNLYESRKEAEFDETGRPHHFLFYTTKPNYYNVLHNVADTMQFLNKMEDKRIHMRSHSTLEDKLDAGASDWLTKEELEKKLLENLSDTEYSYFITSMERLLDHPFSKHASSVIMEYRNQLKFTTDNVEIPALQYDSDNRPFILIDNCLRKTARGQVKIIGNGSGKISINGKDITFFDDIQCREQVSHLKIIKNNYLCIESH